MAFPGWLDLIHPRYFPLLSRLSPPRLATPVPHASRLTKLGALGGSRIPPSVTTKGIEKWAIAPPSPSRRRIPYALSERHAWTVNPPRPAPPSWVELHPSLSPSLSRLYLWCAAARHRVISPSSALLWARGGVGRRVGCGAERGEGQQQSSGGACALVLVLIAGGERGRVGGERGRVRGGRGGWRGGPGAEGAPATGAGEPRGGHEAAPTRPRTS